MIELPSEENEEGEVLNTGSLGNIVLRGQLAPRADPIVMPISETKILVFGGIAPSRAAGSKSKQAPKKTLL